jgi:hypothetical protein
MPAACGLAVVSTLQALERNRELAVLQIKVEGAFVSLVAQDRADLERAAGLLAPVAASLGQRDRDLPRGSTECRVVYISGSWTIYGQRPDETFVYDAADGRLRSTRAI